MGSFTNGIAKLFMIVSAAILLNSNRASSLHFYMPYKNAERCFLEEIPDDTTVLGTLTLESLNYPNKVDNRSMSDTSPGSEVEIKEKLGITVEIKDPNGAIIVQRSLEGVNRQHRVRFNSHMPGDHLLCIRSNSEHVIEERKAWTGRLITVRPKTEPSIVERFRVHIGIEVGGSALDYDQIQEKEKLTEIQLRIRKLMDLTDQIRKEQEYQRLREHRFRQTSESTNGRTFWFAFLQSVMLFVVGYGQVRHLKTFFIMKKLV